MEVVCLQKCWQNPPFTSDLLYGDSFGQAESLRTSLTVETSAPAPSAKACALLS